MFAHSLLRVTTSGMGSTAAKFRLSISCPLAPWHKVAALQPASRGREAVAEESDSGVESPVPRIRGVVNLTQDGTLHERHYHCQSAASAHDRGHGCAQAQPAHPA